MNSHNRLATRLLGCAATGLAIFSLAGGAYAQDSEPVETVVITGYRASLENTIALKKNSTQIIEAVSMEDIGKLPDQSIAEAISRLPGLTAQRLNGRSQNISIRGLAPDFSTTLLNGREQVATSNNRSAQYDQYPSELMAGVVVYKTPTADLVGQGLSGTVDMRTVRPLDYDHQIISFNARGEGGSQGKLNPDMAMYGYRFSGTYVDQYYDGKLGITLGVAQMVSPQQFLEYGNWGFTDVATGVSTSGGAKIQANTDLLTRTSALLTVQYRPDEHWETIIDVFYTKYKDHQGFTRIEFPLVSWGGNSYGTTIALDSGYTVDGSGLVTAGDYTPGVKAVVRRNADRHNNDLGAYGWKTSYSDGGWTTTLDVNFSSVQREDQWFETYAGTGRTADYGGTEAAGPTDTLSFKNNSDDVPIFSSSLDYGDYSLIKLTSSQGWGGYSSKTGADGVTYGEGVHGGQAGYLNYQHVDDYLFTGKLSSEVEFEDSFVKKLSFGVYYSNRHKRMNPEEYYVDLAVNAASYADSGTYSDLVIPAKYRTGVSGALSYFGIPHVVTWNSEALLKDGYYVLSGNENADVSIKGWQVDEMLYTGYVRADIDTDVADMPLTGNVGVQVVSTHQSSDGYASSNTSGLYGGGVEVRGSTNYVDFLPSLNLTLKPSEDAVVRLGAARELVRARMDQMSAANEFWFSEDVNTNYYIAGGITTLNTDHEVWGGTVGNPKLKPWMADAVDLAVEYYFDKDAYIAFAGFYKYLENYIYQKNILFDFTGYSYTGTDTPAIWEGYVTQYVNGTGGNLIGMEVSFALPGRILDEALDGFGVTFNASYTDSNIKQNGTSTNVPGLSKLVYNATIYYEKDGFSIRLNESFRSKFLGEVTGFGAGLETYNIDAQAWLDGQIGYTFQGGSLEGLSMLLQVNNITNQTQVRYNELAGSPNNRSRVMDWQRYGTNFLFGVTYKM